MVRSVVLRTFVVLSTFALAACGAGDSSVGGGTGGGKGNDAGSTGGGAGGGSGGGFGCSNAVEVCNQIDDDCDGQVDEGFDQDGDGMSECAEDCNDLDATIFPGATETLNQKDDDCDGKIDNKIVGRDYDGDGYSYGAASNADCNDEEPLVGPGAIEVAGDSVDNNCNGATDEAIPSCEASATGTTALDFLKAMELCQAPTQSPTWNHTNTATRNIRPRFGATTTPWAAKAGTKMIMMSSGNALDNVSSTPLGSSSYTPQRGTDLSLGVSPMFDLTELTVTLKVPQNAKSFSFDFAFFTSEFPEYVGSSYNDAFEAVLTSKALPATFTASSCPDGSTGCRAGNVSFDGAGKRVSVNNNYMTVCLKESGNTKTSLCAANTLSQLNGTGYEVVKVDDDGVNRPVGGGTGWLSTKAPVKPGEVITLKFRVYDEGDHILDSAVVIDNFKWETTAVTAPSTSPIN